MECTVLDECHFGSSPELSRASIWLFARAAADICYKGFAEGELTPLLSLHWLERYLGAPPQMVQTRYTTSSSSLQLLGFLLPQCFPNGWARPSTVGDHDPDIGAAGA